jgi:hypothetical protein
LGKRSAREKTAQPGRRRRRLLWFLPWLLAMAPVCVILWPSVLLTAALMVPSGLSLVLFGRREAHLIAAIAVLNLVGILPSLARLWDAGHEGGVALWLLSDPLVWGYALAGAGAGLVLFFLTEWLVAAYYRITAETRLHEVIARQERLVELWGDEVIGTEAARLMAEGGHAAPGEHQDTLHEEPA